MKKHYMNPLGESLSTVTVFKWELSKVICKIFGHKLIVVNNIFDPDSKDRLCKRCGWNNCNQPQVPPECLL
jgi:hypothetical protein